MTSRHRVMMTKTPLPAGAGARVSITRSRAPEFALPCAPRPSGQPRCAASPPRARVWRAPASKLPNGPRASVRCGRPSRAASKSSCRDSATPAARSRACSRSSSLFRAAANSPRTAAPSRARWRWPARRPRAVLPFADVVHLFANEFARLRRRSFPFALVFPRSL
jgi:hypothetical protein